MQTLQSASRLVILTAVLAACSGGSGNGTRTAALMITATATAGPAGPVFVPLGTGQLQLDGVLFRVGDVEIEIHQPCTREASHSGTTLASENEGGENEHEGENEEEGEIEDEILLPGPYTFDLAAGPTVIEQVSVTPGTFDHVDLRFLVTPDTPFENASIVVRGFFLDGTAVTPFTLRSDYDRGMRVPVANGGITVTANSVVPVELKFDLDSMFTHLDFASATVEGGEILIDETHNVGLLLAFEFGLHGCVNLHERDD